MNILMCANYVTGNIGSHGLFDFLMEEFGVSFECNFEQVLGLARDCEIEKLIIWTAGWNWARSEQAGYIYAADAVKEVRKVNSDLPILVMGVDESYDPPEGVIICRKFTGTSQETMEKVVAFLTEPSYGKASKSCP